jgi:hypothetical protein
MDKEMELDKQKALDDAAQQGTIAGVTQVAQQQHLMDNGMGGDEDSPNPEQGDKK